MTDVLDCALGVLFCTAAIVAVISPLGRHWGVFAGALALCLISGGLFIGRWSRRGVFQALSARHQEPPAIDRHGLSTSVEEKGAVQ